MKIKIWKDIEEEDKQIVTRTYLPWSWSLRKGQEAAFAKKYTVLDKSNGQKAAAARKYTILDKLNEQEAAIACKYEWVR